MNGENETATASAQSATRFAVCAVAVIVVVATVGALPIALRTEAFDDAYVTFRYAQHWATGEGLRWNAADDPSFGATSLLYCALLAVGARLGLAPPALAVAVQVAAHIALSVLAFAFLATGQRRAIALTGGLLCALSLPHIMLGVGLETELYTALVVLTLLLFVRGRLAGAGLVSGIAVFARPDAFLLWLAILIGSLFEKDRRVSFTRTLMGSAAPIATWLAATMLLFGTVIPLALSAAPYAGAYPPHFRLYGLFEHWAGQPVIAICLPFALIGACASVFTRHRAAVLWLGLYIVVFWASGLPAHRWYYAPPMAGIYLLSFVGIGQLMKALTAPQHRALRLGLAATIVALLLLAARGTVWQVRHSWTSGKVAISAHTAAGQWLRDHVPGDARVLAFESGRIGYVSGLYVMDMYGLLSPALLRHYGAGGWTEVIRQTEFDYAFIPIRLVRLPKEQTFVDVWTSEDDIYRIVQRSAGR